MRKIFIAAFVLTCSVELLSHLLDLPLVHTVAKPLLLPLLIGYYLTTSSKEELSRTVLLALVFSWLGDVLLMFQPQSELFFIGGLLAFLVAHLYCGQKLKQETLTFLLCLFNLF